MAYEMTPDRALVVACLHYAGALNQLVPDDVQMEAYAMGDGYGDFAPEVLAEINDGWDWSHIRDSSPEAIAAIAAYLRSKGFSLPN